MLVLAEKGFVSLDVEYVDGTKIESKANKYTFVWRKTVRLVGWYALAERETEHAHAQRTLAVVLGERSRSVYSLRPTLKWAPLLPKLRGHFAEFLNNASSVGLRILSSSTCVGLRYGYNVHNSGFS